MITAAVIAVISTWFRIDRSYVNWFIVAVNVIILCILSVTSSYASKCSYSGV